MFNSINSEISVAMANPVLPSYPSFTLMNTFNTMNSNVEMLNQAYLANLSKDVNAFADAMKWKSAANLMMPSAAGYLKGMPNLQAHGLGGLPLNVNAMGLLGQTSSGENANLLNKDRGVESPRKKIKRSVVTQRTTSESNLSREGCADLLLNFSQNNKAAPPKKRKYPRDVPNIPSPVFKKDRLEPYNLGPVPAFIVEELKTTSGTGQFTRSELMITLLFAHQLLSQRDSGNGDTIRRGNTYAIIKTRMGDRRSRASIRRKIEKIVSKDTGIPGGLLKEDFRVGMALNSVWKRLVKLLVLAEKTGTPKQKRFAESLREYANQYLEDNSSELERQNLKVEKLKPPSHYSTDETANLLSSMHSSESLQP